MGWPALSSLFYQMDQMEGTEWRSCLGRHSRLEDALNLIMNETDPNARVCKCIPACIGLLCIHQSRLYRWPLFAYDVQASSWVQMQGFADASHQMYGCCVYISLIYTDGHLLHTMARSCLIILLQIQGCHPKTIYITKTQTLWMSAIGSFA